jgi:hypothetical protein
VASGDPHAALRFATHARDCKVRIERLQEISSADAIAEGVEVYAAGKSFSLLKQRLTIQQIAYAHLWDAINADRGFGWEKNPWVWVIDFKRVAQSAVAA